MRIEKFAVTRAADSPRWKVTVLRSYSISSVFRNYFRKVKKKDCRGKYDFNVIFTTVFSPRRYDSVDSATSQRCSGIARESYTGYCGRILVFSGSNIAHET